MVDWHRQTGKHRLWDWVIENMEGRLIDGPTLTLYYLGFCVLFRL